MRNPLRLRRRSHALRASRAPLLLPPPYPRGNKELGTLYSWFVLEKRSLCNQGLLGVWQKGPLARVAFPATVALGTVTSSVR